MDREFYDKYGKEFHCSNCCMLDVCLKKNEPLYGRCWERFAKDKISNLEAKLADKEKEIAVLEEQDGVYHNQLAIAELEKILEFMKQKDHMGFVPSFKKIKLKINQQINELKGEK